MARVRPIPVNLLREINARHGTAFSLGARFRGGEQGAYALTDATSQRLVLKWSAETGLAERAASARAATDTPRTVGYPAPRYLYEGSVASGSYIVLTALPGSPCREISVSLLPRLLELNELQRGRAVADGSDWPDRMIDSVMSGCDGFCLLESLRTYSTETARLLEALQRLVSVYGVELPRGRDIAHMDFTPANVLQSSGTIRGVIDWEGTCAGDAAFDLATLLFYGYGQPDVRAALWRSLRAQRAPGTVAVYLAHLMLRQVDWSIRFHPSAVVTHFLRRSSAILRDLRPSTNGII